MKYSILGILTDVYKRGYNSYEHLPKKLKAIIKGGNKMKIAISAQGKEKTALLDPRFGRCEVFQVYDDSSKNITVIENKGGKSGGGAGIAAAQQIIDENIEVVITGNVGPNAHGLLSGNDIKVCKSAIVSVEDAIKEFEAGNLQDISGAGPAHAGM